MKDDMKDEREKEGSQIAFLFADDVITFRKTKECCQDDDNHESPYFTHLSEQNPFPTNESKSKTLATGNDEESYYSDSSYDSDSSDDINDQNTNTKSGNETVKIGFLTEKYLPIDVQFSIPGILILILYCIASLSFYSFCNEFIELVYKSQPTMSLDTFYSILFVLGVAILRVTGNLWYWTGECQSGRFYKVLKHSKRRRKMFVKAIIEHNTRSSKSLILSRIIQIDTNMIKFFHRHKLFRGFLAVFAFNCIYMSMYYVQSTKLQKYIAEPRDDYLKHLPSVKYLNNNNQHVKSSLMYRTLSLNDVVEDQDIVSNTSCQALSGDIDRFLQLQDELFLEDSNYLYQQLSSNSYYSLMGDKSVYFTNQKKLLLYNSGLYLFCAIILVAMLKWPLLEV